MHEGRQSRRLLRRCVTAAVGAPAADGARTAYPSRNGATDVAAWRIEAGFTEERPTTLATVPRTGFETTATVTPPADADVLVAAAPGPFGEPLDGRAVDATSAAATVSSPPPVEGS